MRGDPGPEEREKQEEAEDDEANESGGAPLQAPPVEGTHPGRLPRGGGCNAGVGSRSTPRETIALFLGPFHPSALGYSTASVFCFVSNSGTMVLLSPTPPTSNPSMVEVRAVCQFVL